LRDKFTVYVKFRLRTRVKYLNISVIHLSLPDFREKVVGLGLGLLHFGTEMFTKYVDPGPCLTWQNRGDREGT